MDIQILHQAVKKIKSAIRVIAFTGAGISVESGIPPFRGPGGLWSMYDQEILNINYFLSNPDDAWKKIKEIFYDNFEKASPNPAHIALAKMESLGYLKCIITQNIDHLHQDAGNIDVIEYHGTSRYLICTVCHQIYMIHENIFKILPPRCQNCQGILKPDFVFFGEPIPIIAQERSTEETYKADVWIVIGTTGEVFPACSLPIDAKHNGKTIIEINIKPSSFTNSITDYFIQEKAGLALPILLDEIIH